MSFEAAAILREGGHSCREFGEGGEVGHKTNDDAAEQRGSISARTTAQKHPEQTLTLRPRIATSPALPLRFGAPREARPSAFSASPPVRAWSPSVLLQHSPDIDNGVSFDVTVWRLLSFGLSDTDGTL